MQSKTKKHSKSASRSRQGASRNGSSSTSGRRTGGTQRHEEYDDNRSFAMDRDREGRFMSDDRNYGSGRDRYMSMDEGRYQDRDREGRFMSDDDNYEAGRDRSFGEERYQEDGRRGRSAGGAWWENGGRNSQTGRYGRDDDYEGSRRSYSRSSGEDDNNREYSNMRGGSSRHRSENDYRY